MKALRLYSRMVFSFALTLGMSAAYFFSHKYMKDLVTPALLPILLMITFFLSLAFAQKKAGTLSDLITTFLAYNLVTAVYLTYLIMTDLGHENIIADFIKASMFMLLGYPIVLLTLAPALITSMLILSVCRKYRPDY